MLTTIAWNGIRVSVPSTWELGRIEARHLFFHHRDAPAMEIKWEPVKGRFSHRSHLKKLMARQKRHPGRHLEAWHLPSTWEKALSNFTAHGFSWRSGAENGRGALLFCPHCNTAIIFQIFNIIDGHMPHGTLLNILESLQDHRSDDRTAWAVFDIEALLPRAFQLDNYRFKPGNFELAFYSGHQSIKLLRWAPATALLKETDLIQFAAKALAVTRENLIDTTFLEQPAVEWQPETVSRRSSWIDRFKPQPAFQWGRVWHVAEKNRILGIRFESRKPFNPEQVSDICAKYTVTT